MIFFPDYDIITIFFKKKNYFKKKGTSLKKKVLLDGW